MLPHAIFSTFARHKNPDTNANFAKELKMPTHNPATQTDGMEEKKNICKPCGN